MTDSKLFGLGWLASHSECLVLGCEVRVDRWVRVLDRGLRIIVFEQLDL